jgi:hypothetical protein
MQRGIRIAVAVAFAAVIPYRSAIDPLVSGGRIR